MDWEKKTNTVKAGSRDTTPPQGAPRLVPDRAAEETDTWVTDSAKSGLEVRQLVVPAFVALVAGQGHGLALVREAFKHSDVHEVILVHLNLKGESSEGQVGPLIPPPPGSLDLAGRTGRPWMPGGCVPSRSQRLDLRTLPPCSFKYKGCPRCPASTPHPHSLHQSPQSPERQGPLLQGGRSTHVHTHAHAHMRARTHTHACTHMLTLDSHQTPEAEGCHRTLLSTPALGTCELPLQPDSPKRLTPHLDQVVHSGDHLAPEFHSLEHWELLVHLLLQLGLHLGKGRRERQVSSPVLDVTAEL